MSETEAAPRLDGWTIVFDLDGTLVESAPDLLNALNHAIAPLGLGRVALDDIRTMIGQGAKAMIRKAFAQQAFEFNEDLVEDCWIVFLDHYRENIAVDSHAFEGVEEALQALLKRGATLSVCTNKTQALSELLLDELRLSHHFAAIVGADAVRDKKPDAGHIFAAVDRANGDRSKSIMVGDSRTDEKAARNAGLPFIFTPLGYEAASADAIEAVAILHHYSTLSDLVTAVVA